MKNPLAMAWNARSKNKDKELYSRRFFRIDKPRTSKTFLHPHKTPNGKVYTKEHYVTPCTVTRWLEAQAVEGHKDGYIINIHTDIAFRYPAYKNNNKKVVHPLSDSRTGQTIFSRKGVSSIFLQFEKDIEKAGWLLADKQPPAQKLGVNPPDSSGPRL